MVNWYVHYVLYSSFFRCSTRWHLWSVFKDNWPSSCRWDLGSYIGRILQRCLNILFQINFDNYEQVFFSSMHHTLFKLRELHSATTNWLLLPDFTPGYGSKFYLSWHLIILTEGNSDLKLYCRQELSLKDLFVQHDAKKLEPLYTPMLQNLNFKFLLMTFQVNRYSSGLWVAWKQQVCSASL